MDLREKLQQLKQKLATKVQSHQIGNRAKNKADQTVQKMKDSKNMIKQRSSIRKDKIKKTFQQKRKKFIQRPQETRKKIAKRLNLKDKATTFSKKRKEMFATAKEAYIERKNATFNNLRYFSLFGCTFAALILTKRIPHTVAGFGLAAAFLYPEYIMDYFKKN
ncbi:unnamed protein product [Moneuplotes crassus]|uniref:Uncharacterized protein n=1 Tax=Euplotes crassus TaxID=5936 RepID=A0AAD1Y218_EUPCR|nr:unnamed protein product [Moneuplotes crassus]